MLYYLSTTYVYLSINMTLQNNNIKIAVKHEYNEL